MKLNLVISLTLKKSMRRRAMKFGINISLSTVNFSFKTKFHKILLEQWLSTGVRRNPRFPSVQSRGSATS